MKKSFYIGAAALTVAGLVIGYVWLSSSKSGVEAKADPPGLVRRAAQVERQTLRIQVSATGTVQPIYKIDIKSKASGSVLSLKLNEGDFVKKGDIIATIEKTDMLAAYNQAKASYEVAKATLQQQQILNQRRKDLFAQKFISQEEMDASNLDLERAKSQLVSAQAAFEQALIRYNDTVVRSPIDGMVLDKPVDEGQVIMGGLNTVSGGTTIVTVADMNKVYVNANVDEVDVGKIKVGQDAQIVADAFPEERFTGKVLRIDPLAKVEQNVTRFPVVIEVPNPRYRLLAGMNATVTIVVLERLNALVVPIEALKEPSDMRGDGASRQGKSASSAVDGQRAAFKPDSAWRMATTPSMEKSKGDSAQGGLTRVKPRIVMAKDSSGGYSPKMISVGVTNFDVAEIVDGLKEGDEIEYTTFSRAKLEGQQFQDRIRSSSGFGGAPQGGGQRRAARQ